MLFFRFGIATTVLWAGLLLWRRHGGPDVLDVPRLKAFAVGILFGYMTITGFLALRYLDASVYIVIVYLYPVLVVVGSSMLGHRVTAGVWVALAVVMSGIVLTVPELFGGVGEISVLGVVLTLVQAVLMAAFMIVNSKVMPGHIDGTVSAAWNCLGALVLMTPLAFGSGFHAPETRTVVLEVLLFGLVPTVIANVCFFRALRHIAPGVVAMIMTMEVALAIFWSWLSGRNSARLASNSSAPPSSSSGIREISTPSTDMLTSSGSTTSISTAGSSPKPPSPCGASYSDFSIAMIYP